MIEAAAPPEAYLPRTRAPWGLVDIAFVFGIVFVALLAVPLSAFGLMKLLGIDSDAPERSAGGTAIELGAQLVLDGVAVAAGAVFSLVKYKRGPEAWSLVRPPRIRLGFDLAVLAGCFVILLIYNAITIALPFEALKPESNVPNRLFDHAAVVPLTVAFIVAIAPVVEELFFRGFLLHGLWGRFGFWPAALASGWLFGAIHLTSFDNVGIILPFAVIGTLLAWVVQRTGSLWNAIIVHALFNTVSISGYLVQRFAA